MRLNQNWDTFFGQFGGRIFTLGAISVAFGMVSLFVVFAPNFTDFDRTAEPLNHKDLLAFVRAGEMAVNGDQVAAYDASQFQAGLPEGNDGHLWLYPPTAFFAVVPLFLAPFGAVKTGWIVVTLLAALLVARLSGPRKPLNAVAIAFSPGTFCALFIFQVGGIVAAALSFAFSQAQKRPILAGVALGLLTIKPQYGLMAPVFLIATRNWISVFSAAVTAVALAASSLAVFGADAWAAFFASIGTSHASLASLAQQGGVSASQLAIKLGGGAVAALTAQSIAVVMGVASVALASRRLNHVGLVAVTLYASLAAAPSAWIYDWPLVAASLAFYAGAKPVWSVKFQLAALVLWIAVLPAMFGVGGDRSLYAPLALFLGLIGMLVGLLRTPKLTGAIPVSMPA